MASKIDTIIEDQELSTKERAKIDGSHHILERRGDLQKQASALRKIAKQNKLKVAPSNLRKMTKIELKKYLKMITKVIENNNEMEIEMNNNQIAEELIDTINESTTEQDINKIDKSIDAEIKNEEIIKEDLKTIKEPRKKAKKSSTSNSKSKKDLKTNEEKSEKTEEQIKTNNNEKFVRKSDFNDEERKYIVIDPIDIPDTGVKSLKQIEKRQKQLTSKYSKEILEGAIVTTTNYKPVVSEHVIELNDVIKSYITGDLETPVLKGVDIQLNKGDFIVILGPSGSGKTTFLNIISGLDKATKGDVFVLGSNLSLLKDSHLTKFRRKNVGFIFQQYNLLTNLTAKENAEVGENLSKVKNKELTIEDIFETIGMKEQMNKYPHQMSGGQQQRVSIARALAKNPDILFADEPTGALDEEMGRKVLEILVQVNKRYGTTVVVVTHNPNIAKIGNTVLHIKNGLIDQIIKNEHPADPSTID